MKNLIIQLTIFLITLSGYSQDTIQKKLERIKSEVNEMSLNKDITRSTFYFIRHAEKDRSDPKNKNPNLTEIGKDRAIRWRDFFKHVQFDVVYSTDYNRTKQTARPTAEENNLEITLYNPRQINGSTFLENNSGKTVLVVGHSNTTPKFVNAILNEEKFGQIDDNNNGNLYVVSIINNNMSVALYHVN